MSFYQRFFERDVRGGKKELEKEEMKENETDSFNNKDMFLKAYCLPLFPPPGK